MSLQTIESLVITLKFGDAPISIGQLVLKNHQVWFEYDKAFLQRNFHISPFKLPLGPGVHHSQDRVFEGLFGVFNDSLPDGWGRLLLDRQVQHLGILPQSLTPLDRLAYVGESGMGALCYHPQKTTHQTNDRAIALDKLAEDSRRVLSGNSEAFFEELLTLSGASSGARPKIIAAVSQDKKIIQTAGEYKDNFEDWMIKFSALNDLDNIAQIEYAYSLMAKAAGIEMPETYLFETKKGAYFATKCFDRAANKRFHMHTLSGLLHADHRVPSIDYEQALRCTYVLTKDVLQLEKHYRLAVFNVLAHNRDDHAKNFAYLMDASGEWKFSPAYDLTFSYGPGGEQSMLVMGEGRHPSKDHLLQLGKRLAINHAKQIIDEVNNAIHSWEKFAKQAGVDKKMISMIAKLIN